VVVNGSRVVVHCFERMFIRDTGSLNSDVYDFKDGTSIEITASFGILSFEEVYPYFFFFLLPFFINLSLVFLLTVLVFKALLHIN
jgi:hypothetical protein